MSWKTEFEAAEGFDAVDLSTRLTGAKGRAFLDWAKDAGCRTIIRYYASTPRPKTLTRAEARAIGAAGLHVLPVFQDIHRAPEHFSAEIGAADAAAARAFARKVGQPEGTTLVFAADLDADAQTVDQRIVPHFAAIRAALAGRFRIGAYGAGGLLARLLDDGLIDIAWLSMQRGHAGTQAFFRSKRWALRQVPPEQTRAESGLRYDRNVCAVDPAALGAFRPGAPDRAAGATATAPADAYVTTEGLNLRDAPNGTILTQLTLGDPVVDLGAAPGGWRRVRAAGREGFAFGKYLRPPAAPPVEALLRLTIDEWLRFDKGRGLERNAPYYGFIAEMWRAIGIDLDGRDDVPWSAAFISWVTRRAGPAYARFLFSQRHSEFVHDAIQARIMGQGDRPFWGYRRTEQRPALGDIVQKNAKGGTITFDFAESNARYSSHSDIVVEVTPGVARVIGGNVADTVALRHVNAVSGDDIQEYLLDESGFIRDGQGVIAILKNRAHLTGG